MMKLFTYLIPISAYCFLLPAYAQDPVQVTIGEELYTEQYREYKNDNKSLIMQERAPMMSLFGHVRIPFADHHHISVLGRIAYGSTHYKGQKEQVDGPVSEHDNFGELTYSGVDRYLLQLDTKYEYTFPFANLTPSIGLGYRQLTDRSDQIEEGGYRRVSRYYYASTGVSALFPITDTWQFSPQFTYQYLIKGKQYSHLEGYMNGLTAINHQQHGHGVEIALGLTHAFAHSQSTISVTPFYRYWHIGLSERFYTNAEKTEGTIEPENKTQELGLRINYMF